jgi:hypothetical protein
VQPIEFAALDTGRIHWTELVRICLYPEKSSAQFSTPLAVALQKCVISRVDLDFVYIDSLFGKRQKSS